MINDSDRGILWLKLSPESRERLLTAYPPAYADVYCDHVTLLFDVSRADVAHDIGRHEHVEIYAYAWNNHIDAVRVRSQLPDTYGVPHITLSAQSGVDAFESVAMLRGEHEEKALDTPLDIAGIIEFVPLPA